MPTVDLRLRGDGGLEDVRDKITFGEPNALRILVLPGGMTSGQPSVAIAFELPDGRWAAVQTSARILVSSARAIAGAYPMVEEG